VHCGGFYGALGILMHHRQASKKFDVRKRRKMNDKIDFYVCPICGMNVAAPNLDTGNGQVFFANLPDMAFRCWKCGVKCHAVKQSDGKYMIVHQPDKI
jgi:hypothetical protein